MRERLSVSRCFRNRYQDAGDYLDIERRGWCYVKHETDRLRLLQNPNKVFNI